MIPKNFTTPGIILKRNNYAEADRIISLFTKNFGKISLIAKSVRKPKSKKRGSLEIFGLAKFQITRGKNLNIATEVEIIDSFSEVRQNLTRVSVAYFFVEAVMKMTREEEKHTEVFDLLHLYLNKLKKEHKLKTLRQNFVYELLVILGFWPKDKRMDNPDQILENIVERKLFSIRVGKKLVE